MDARPKGWVGWSKKRKHGWLMTQSLRLQRYEARAASEGTSNATEGVDPGMCHFVGIAAHLPHAFGCSAGPGSPLPSVK